MILLFEKSDTTYFVSVVFNRSNVGRICIYVLKNSLLFCTTFGHLILGHFWNNSNMIGLCVTIEFQKCNGSLIVFSIYYLFFISSGKNSGNYILKWQLNNHPSLSGHGHWSLPECVYKWICIYMLWTTTCSIIYKTFFIDRRNMSSVFALTD